MDVSRVLLLWVLLSSQLICHFTTSHNCIASHHMASQPTISHKHIASQPHNIPCHPMVSHHITSHQVTSHDSARQHVASHTAHHMAWHDISPTTALAPPHLTSQPTTLHTSSHLATMTSYHVTSPHSTSRHHHRHTTETQPATTKIPPSNGMAEGWRTQKTRFGQRTGWWHRAHSIGKFFLWLIGSVPPETSAPGLSGTICV